MTDSETAIARMVEETRKFVAKQHKLMAEREKFFAEQHKLYAEQQKLDAERGKMVKETMLAPWQLVALSAGAAASLMLAGAALAKLFLG